MLVTGSCHCGNVSFRLTRDPDPDHIPARACGCSFCTKHGGVWTSNPAGSLRAMVRDPALVAEYRFGTGTAVFHVCTRCGAVPFVTSDIAGRRYAVVSVNAFDDVDRALLRPAQVSFEDETQEQRLARRQRGWIADVRIEHAA